MKISAATLKRVATGLGRFGVHAERVLREGFLPTDPTAAEIEELRVQWQKFRPEREGGDGSRYLRHTITFDGAATMLGGQSEFLRKAIASRQVERANLPPTAPRYYLAGVWALKWTLSRAREKTAPQLVDSTPPPVGYIWQEQAEALVGAKKGALRHLFRKTKLWSVRVGKRTAYSKVMIEKYLLEKHIKTAAPKQKPKQSHLTLVSGSQHRHNRGRVTGNPTRRPNGSQPDPFAVAPTYSDPLALRAELQQLREESEGTFIDLFTAARLTNTRFPEYFLPEARLRGIKIAMKDGQQRVRLRDLDKWRGVKSDKKPAKATGSDAEPDGVEIPGDEVVEEEFDLMRFAAKR